MKAQGTRQDPDVIKGDITARGGFWKTWNEVLLERIREELRPAGVQSMPVGSSSKADKAKRLFAALDLDGNGKLSTDEVKEFADRNRINFSKLKEALGLESASAVSKKAFVAKYVAGELAMLDHVVEAVNSCALRHDPLSPHHTRGYEDVDVTVRSPLCG